MSAKARSSGTPGIPGRRSSRAVYQPLVRPRRRSTRMSASQPRAAQPLQRAAPVAQVAVLLQPAVHVKHPVDRLHAVVGHDEHGRLLAEALPGRLDQAPAGGVDRLVDLHQLVARVGRVVGGVVGVKPGIAQMPGEVGAHEVDHQHAQVGLELEALLAHRRHLVDVLDQEPRVAVEVLPPALAHWVVGGDQAGMAGPDGRGGRRRHDLRLGRAAVARDRDAGHLLGGIGEGHGHERRPDPGGAQCPPQRRAGAAAAALDARGGAIGVGREVEDAVAGGIEAGDERRPRGRAWRRAASSAGAHRPRRGRFRPGWAGGPRSSSRSTSSGSAPSIPRHRTLMRGRACRGRARPAPAPAAAAARASPARCARRSAPAAPGRGSASGAPR